MNKLFKVSVALIFLFYSCKEKPVLPTLSTTNVTEITTKTAVSGGSITDDGGARIIARGVCWDTLDNPTIENNKTIQISDSLSFTSNITQLSPNTLYFLRAYATNSEGTGYGKSLFFKTLGDKPNAKALDVSYTTINSSTLNGSVNPNSLETIVTFEYGISTSYGKTILAQQSPLSGDSYGNVTADLTELTPATAYHFRIKAENSLGISYSSDMSFITLGQVPRFTAMPVTNITPSSATLNGLVNPNFLPTSVSIEYGSDINYGNILLVTQNPVTGNSDIGISANLTGLTELEVFHYRFKAENSLGIIKSNDMTFSTSGLLRDIDGNTYKTVLIGGQKWMAENLRTIHFANGSPIFNGEVVANNCDKKPYYFNYNMDLNNTTIYGLLYNYYAASNSIEPTTSDLIPSGIQGACPTGWHLPSIAEYQIMIDFLGGTDIAGGKLKSLQLWENPNVGATNSSSFNALPAGGYDKLNFNYGGLNQLTFFWSTSSSLAYLKGIGLDHSSSKALIYVTPRCTGFSIRCVKD